MTAKYYFYAEIKSRVLNEAQSQSPSHTLPIRNLLKNYVSKVLSSSNNIMLLFCSVEMILSSEEQEVNFHMFQRKTGQSLQFVWFLAGGCHASKHYRVSQKKFPLLNIHNTKTTTRI